MPVIPSRVLGAGLALPLVLVVAAPSGAAGCTPRATASAQVLRVVPPTATGLPTFTQSTARVQQTGPGTDHSRAGATTTDYTFPAPAPGVRVQLGTASATATATTTRSAASSDSATQVGRVEVTIPSVLGSPGVAVVGHSLRSEAATRGEGAQHTASAGHFFLSVGGARVPLSGREEVVPGVVRIAIASTSTSGTGPVSGSSPATATATLLRLQLDDALGGAEIVIGEVTSESSTCS